MGSREIADLCVKRHDHVLRDIRAMLISLYGEEEVQNGLPDRDKMEAFFEKMGWGIDSPDLGNGRVAGIRVQRDARGFVAEICLDHNHTMTLVSGYNVKLRKAIIDKWQELESQVAAPPALTPAEMFLQNAQAMVAVERRQLAQAQELARISESVDTLMLGAMTLTERPANSEAITHIRHRMLQKYQLPARIVDLVMRQMPYSPKPAGMVRNHREEAQGTSYAVYWVKDVNTTFNRFVRDCKRVTATKVTHPDIDERFTLAPGAED
nr:Rha family transcriptional regulator [Comamonas thiooxydans]